MSKYNVSAAVDRNTGLKCETSGCNRNRSYTWRYCEACHYAIRHHGAVGATKVPRDVTRAFTHTAAKFLEPYRKNGHKGVLAAEKLLEEYLRECATRRYSKAERLIGRLFDAGIKGADVLNALCAMWILQYHRPQFFVSDNHFRFCVGHAVVRLVPGSPFGAYNNRSTNGANNEIYSDIIRTLGVFLAQFIKAYQDKSGRLVGLHNDLHVPLDDSAKEN